MMRVRQLASLAQRGSCSLRRPSTPAPAADTTPAPLTHTHTDEDRTWQLQGTEAELDVSAYCAGQAALGLAAVALEGLLLRLLTYLALRLCARGLSLEGAVAALARRARRGLRRRPAT